MKRKSTASVGASVARRNLVRRLTALRYRQRFQGGLQAFILADRVGDLLEFAFHFSDGLPAGGLVDLLGPHPFRFAPVFPAGFTEHGEFQAVRLTPMVLVGSLRCF
jgi:hypothetical protein